LALAGLGSAAEEAYPNLVRMVQNTAEKPEIRLEAAVAMARVGDVPAARAAVPALLKIVANPSDDPRVRERVIWALRVHNANLRRMPNVYESFTSVLNEQPVQANRMLRYDCAFMLGMLQGPAVPKVVMDTLHDFLKDESIQIYVGTNINTSG